MLAILRPALLAGLAVTVWTAAPLAAQTPDNPPAPQVVPPAAGSEEACGQKLERFIGSISKQLDGTPLTSEAQRRAYDSFNEAAAKAQEFVREACANEKSAANIKQIEAAEKQIAVALDSLRPALENFYASLSDEQKKQLNSLPRQLEAWAKDWWMDFAREVGRQLREHQARRPGPGPDEMRFCFEDLCLSIPDRFADRPQEQRGPEPPLDEDRI
jgi:LTXXQ motif family protein